mgnify:CR=1 FL=1
MEIRKTMKQYGVIVFGMNWSAQVCRNWVKEAEEDGFTVRWCDGYAEMWR